MLLEEMKKIQQILAEKVIAHDQLPQVRFVAGVDVSCSRFHPEVYGAICILTWPELALVESAYHHEIASIPYIPGYLGFREIPTLLKAYEKLEQKPDLLFVDGMGISHPRGLGIASHLGVLVDKPSIGVGKSILVGKVEGANLVHKGKTIGAIVPTKKGSNPLIISTGHRISLETACLYVKQALRNYKLPEPTRLAHIHSNKHRLSELEKIL